MNFLLQTIPTVLLYTAVTIAWAIFTKGYLSNYRVPLTLLWVQALVASAALKSCILTGVARSKGSTWFLVSWRLHAVSALSLILGTLALGEMDVSSYHILARSLTIPFSALLSRIVIGQRISWMSFFGCLLIFAGYATTVAIENGEKASFTKNGLEIGVAASVVSALLTVMVRTAQPANSDLETVYHGNLFFVLFGLPLIWFEGEEISRLLADPDATTCFFNAALVIGSLSVLVNFAIARQIRNTASLTHAFAVSLRGVSLTYLGISFFAEPVTGGKILGSVFVFFGTFAFLARSHQKQN
jgi:hypothetical protein